MQMAKTVAALERLKDAKLPFISVLLHPTTGGVAASFALLGDVNLAEPGALIGFAGPRVIESTIRQKLPEGFQRSEFLLAHGMVDRIVSRLDMKREIAAILGHLLSAAPGAPAPAARAIGNGSPHGAGDSSGPVLGDSLVRLLQRASPSACAWGSSRCARPARHFRN